MCVPGLSEKLEQLERKVLPHTEDEECFTRMRPECEPVKKTLPAREVCPYTYETEKGKNI